MIDKKKLLEEILNKPHPLSDDQRKAVVSSNRYLRIVAGAGTGKTETLTRRIVYLLLHEQEEPKSIVAFTFTERAAQGMKSRIYERVRQLGADEVCAKLGEMYVGTIHGYCLRLLEDFFGFGGYDVLDEHQEMAFLLREGWGLGLYKSGESYIKNCVKFLRSVNVVYDELIDREELGKKVPDFVKKLEKFEESLKEHKLLTFGRMVSLAVEKLESRPEILSNIKHLLVDEYQDINRVQERLIELIGHNASVFVVGDPRQTIYQWRGSNEKCFEVFPNKFAECETVQIKANRRSGQKIVDLANLFASTFQRAEYEPLEPAREDEGLVVLVGCNTPESEAEWIASQIKQLVDKKICNFSDICVLLRSVRTSAEPFLNAFRKHDFPFLVGGKVGLFKRDEAQVVGRLFAWLWEDGFWVEDPQQWATQIKGDKLLETAIEKWSGIYVNRSRVTLQEELESWKRGVLNDKFNDITSAYQELLKTLGFLDLDPSNKLHATIMANLGRFNALLTDYESSMRRGGRRPAWPNILKGLCWYMNTYATGAYEEQLPEDLRGVDAIQIMTVHQAKGLEWPVVFVPCLTQERFPASGGRRQWEWYLPPEMFEVSRYQGEIEDERRLFYVAITRARDCLCLSYFKRKKRITSPSRFVESIWTRVEKLTEHDALPTPQIKRKPDEVEVQTFTAGEIIAYLRCPYLYRLRELWRYRPGLSPMLGYGKSLHYCLKHVAEKIKEGRDLDAAIQEAVKEKFYLPYANPRLMETERNNAEGKLLAFTKKHRKDLERVKGVEVRLEFPVEKATIAGRVDIIIREEGENPGLEVRDYKTSDDVTTFEHSSLQVRLYSLGLKMIGHPIVKGSVAYLENGEIKDVDVNAQELQKAKEIAQKCIQGIIERSYRGNPGEECERCDFPAICRYCQNVNQKL
jgi:DNA helicase-2/ATP-dependent DNA helicase PcrA